MLLQSLQRQATSVAIKASCRDRVTMELTKTLSLEDNSMSSVEMHRINSWRKQIETSFFSKTKLFLECQRHEDC